VTLTWPPEIDSQIGLKGRLTVHISAVLCYDSKALFGATFRAVRAICLELGS